MKTRIIWSVIVIVLIVLTAVVTYRNTTDDKTITPGWPVGEESAGRPAGNPANDPAGNPADNPAGNLADNPAGNPADNPAGNLADNPAGNLADDPAGNPANNPAGKAQTDKSVSEEPAKGPSSYNGVIETRGINAFLEGYWHSAPDFSRGELATIEFYGNEYLCLYKSADGTRYVFGWDIRGNNVLELYPSSDPQYRDSLAYETVPVPAHCDFEYIEKDAATLGPALILDGKKYWKMSRPDDFINGSPLYINYAGNLSDRDYQDREKITKGPFAGEHQLSHVLILGSTGLYDIRIIRVSYNDFGDGYRYYYEGDHYRLGGLSSKQYMEYIGVSSPGSAPGYAVSLMDRYGRTHVYAFSSGGRALPFCVNKVEIHNKPE